MKKHLTAALMAVCSIVVVSHTASAGTISNSVSVRSSVGCTKTITHANIDRQFTSNSHTQYSKVDHISEKIKLPDGMGYKTINSTIGVNSYESAHLVENSKIYQKSIDNSVYHQFDQTTSAGMAY